MHYAPGRAQSARNSRSAALGRRAERRRQSRGLDRSAHVDHLGRPAGPQRCARGGERSAGRCTRSGGGGTAQRGLCGRGGAGRSWRGGECPASRRECARCARRSRLSRQQCGRTRYVARRLSYGGSRGARRRCAIRCCHAIRQAGMAEPPARARCVSSRGAVVNTVPDRGVRRRRRQHGAPQPPKAGLAGLTRELARGLAPAPRTSPEK